MRTCLLYRSLQGSEDIVQKISSGHNPIQAGIDQYCASLLQSPASMTCHLIELLMQVAVPGALRWPQFSHHNYFLLIPKNSAIALRRPYSFRPEESSYEYI